MYRKWILQDKPSFMTEPDKESLADEVDEGNERALGTENSIDVQVKLPTFTPKGIYNEVGCIFLIR